LQFTEVFISPEDHARLSAEPPPHNEALYEQSQLRIAEAKHQLLEERMLAKLAAFPMKSLPSAMVAEGCCFNHPPTPQQWRALQLELDADGDVPLESLARIGLLQRIGINAPDDPNPSFVLFANVLHEATPDDVYWAAEWERRIRAAGEPCERQVGSCTTAT
jgi:hypothetical protein